LYKREIEAAKDKDSERKKRIAEYEEVFANPYKAAELGYIDAVIEPAQTRRALCQAFDVLKSKRERGPARKHGNLPL